MAFKIKTLTGLVNAALHIKTAGGIVPAGMYAKTAEGVRRVGGADQPWLVAGSQCYGSIGRTTRAVTHSVQRIPIKVAGGDISTLKLGFMNCYPHNSSDRIMVGLGNAYTIVRASVELLDGSAYAPILFSGAEGIVVENASAQVLSDELTPQSLGLQKFSDGQQMWVRLELTVPTAGAYWPYSYNIANATGYTVAYYDPAQTTISGAYATGAITSTGVSPALTQYPVPVVLLGKYTNADSARRSTLVMGSSVDLRQDDFDNLNISSEAGGGYAARALYRTNSAMLNLAVAGATSKMYSTSSVFFSVWFPYVERCIDGIGNNDLALGYTSAEIITRLTSRAGDMRAGGIGKIIRPTLSPRTTSTDNWATESNQTYVTGFGPGSQAANLKQWFLETDLYDVVIDITSTDGVDPWKWFSNGTIRYATTDGTHPTTVMHVAMATEFQAALA